MKEVLIYALVLIGFCGLAACVGFVEGMPVIAFAGLAVFAVTTITAAFIDGQYSDTKK